MRVVKVLNNNVLLAAEEDGRPVILTGRGLAFDVEVGDDISSDRATQVFRPEAGESPAAMASFLVDLPPERLALAARLLERACIEFGTEFRQNNVIPLADHLHYALARHQRGEIVEYPLSAEVPHLFPAEYAFGLRALAVTYAETGVRLPDGEAIPIALHLVNAQLSAPDMHRTMILAELLDQVFDVLDEAFQKVDRRSVSAARFITHLRYFFARHAAGRAVDVGAERVARALEEEYPQAHAVALRVRLLLELRLRGPISDAEVAYLTVHIARLMLDLQKGE
ncbi:MAG: PRD domain-containing protein [Propionicimonas sp.]|jgi:beta-glucoside operon transcriptional antiterminator